jgi:Protein of unknown function (DUF2785)
MARYGLRGGILVVVALLSSFLSAQTEHDREFWRAIPQNKYAVPANESADALAHELSAMLASADPELRDDLAYSILARWIYRGFLTKPALISLTDEWRTNLNSGLGENGTNSVLKRSFSALCLASMAQHEARAPFMGDERYHSLVAQATSYLQAERDLRGYDSSLHWIHATAHTADLLAALAQNPKLTNAEATTILQAVVARLSTAPQVYTQGEQDRLAAAVVSVVERKDFDVSTFEPWLNAIDSEDRNVWTATTPESLARYQNHTYMLQALAVRMMIKKDSAQIAQCNEKVLAVLAKRTD